MKRATIALHTRQAREEQELELLDAHAATRPAAPTLAQRNAARPLGRGDALLLHRLALAVTAPPPGSREALHAAKLAAYEHVVVYSYCVCTYFLFCVREGVSRYHLH